MTGDGFQPDDGFEADGFQPDAGPPMMASHAPGAPPTSSLRASGLDRLAGGATLRDLWNMVKPWQYPSVPDAAPQQAGESARDAAARGAHEGFAYLASPEGISKSAAMVAATLPGAAKAASGADPSFFEKWLGNKATEWGRKVITGGAQPIGPTKKALSEGAVREAYNQGAIKPLGTTAGTAKRLAGAREAVGSQYGDILNELEARGVHGPDAEALANQIESKASQSTQNTLGSPVPDFLQARAEELRTKALPVSGKGRLGLMQAEHMKRGLQRDAQANFSSASPQPQVGEARMGLASDMRQAIEDAVQQQSALAPEQAAAFEPVKEQMSRVIEAETAARKAAARMSQHKHHSLSDTVMKGAVVSAGGPAALPEALAMAELSRTGRMRGPSTWGWLAHQGERAAASALRPGEANVLSSLAPELREPFIEWMRRRGTVSVSPASAGAEDQE